MNSMIKSQIEIEFNRRFGGTNLKIKKGGTNEYIISNDEISKVLLVRTVYPIVDKIQKYTGHPAPFYNAEAVVLFRFKILDSVYPCDHISFVYYNPVLKRTDFLIFNSQALEDLLGKVQIKSSRSGFYRMLLWVFRGNFVFLANNLSGEGEWYLLGGLADGGNRDRCMGRDTERDLSDYLNRWDIL